MKEQLGHPANHLCSKQERNTGLEQNCMLKNGSEFGLKLLLLYKKIFLLSNRPNVKACNKAV